MTQRVDAVSYRLRLPAKARIHDVFHVSLLKKFEGQPPATLAPLPNLYHGRALPSPLEVLRSRLNRWELLVHWADRAATDPTWEMLEDFAKTYPDVQLADELFVGEGGTCCGRLRGSHIQKA